MRRRATKASRSRERDHRRRRARRLHGGALRSRANLEPLVIEGFQWGGQLQNTTDVENYPGYPEGIMGPEMMQQFRAQAERFGTRFVTDDADRVELTDGGIQSVFVGDEEHRAQTVILAMGAEPRRLGIPGELELAGRGVSTCGVCDGAFFKGEDVVVIGGGDSAMEDSIFISKYADELTIVHRRDEFRASKIMLDRARERTTSASRPRTCRRSSSPATTASCAPSASERRDRRRRGARGRRRLRRDRPHPALGARRGQVDTRRRRLRPHRAGLDPDQPRRRLRGRRPRRPHLPPGGDRRRHRLHGRARRRVVPARHPPSPEAHWQKGGEPVEVAPELAPAGD